ncbi:MAG: hypothetical protein QOH68_3591 [Nocardioidaceae bacterium]|nr:hypothetical protein [Nocardioidaceae bacterium]
MTQPLPSVYAELLASVGSTGGSLAEDLMDRDERRGVHLFHLLTLLRPLYEGLTQQREALLWLGRRPGIDDDIANLLRESAQKVLSGMETMLAEPDPRVLDEARHLMEIEFLLREFARSPERLELWRHLPEDERAEQFEFGALLRREQWALGIDGRHILFDQEEYRFHSLSVHQQPRGRRRPLPSPDETTGLFRDAADLLHHASRVWDAGLAAVEATRSARGRSAVTEWPTLDAVDAARRMIDETNRAVGLTDS